MSAGRSRLRVVIYARQSLDRAGDEQAVTRQVADCRALAAARGWDVVEVIVDNSMSASTGKERPGYERVLDLMRSCAVDVVVVWHIDRLTRRLLDLEHLVELAEKADVRVATVTGDLDLSTDTGRLLARILAAVARAEVERKGARQRRANAQRRAAGVMLWTRRPFGYDRVGDEVFAVQAEARLLAAAGRAVADGATIASQVRMLNAAGAVTTVGGVWTVSVLRRVLLRPRNAGRVTYRGAETGVTGRWPTILDEDTYVRLVEVLSDPTRRTAPATTLRHWLSGALECGVCGQSMYSGRVRHYLIYRCRLPHLARNMQLLDDVLTAAVLRRLADPAFSSALTGDDASVKAREDLVRLRERRDALTTMLGEGLVSPAVARPQLERLAGEVAGAQARVAAVLGRGPAAVVRGAADPAAVFAALPVIQRRRLFEDLVERCVVLPTGKGASEQTRARALRIDWR